MPLSVSQNALARAADVPPRRIIESANAKPRQIDIVRIYVQYRLARNAELSAMDVLTYSETRANLKEVMERVVADRSAVVITRQKAEAVVMVSLADWNAMEETLHLLSTAANAERLRASIRQLDAGSGKDRELADA